MQPGSVRRMIIRNRDTIDICEKQSEVPNERIIFGNDYNSLINFINLRGTFHPLLSSAIMQFFKKPETLDFTGKIYKKAFVSVYHILSFARGVKISLWGKNWGKLWGMRAV